jgi:hypothetical protein
MLCKNLSPFPPAPFLPPSSRAAPAYVARRRTAATDAERMAVLGLSRPESVPNLPRRFESWLASDEEILRRYQLLEEELEWDIPAGDS